MKPINEVYPGACKQEKENGKFYDDVCDYNPLLESIGFEIVLKVDDEDYSGDSRLLFKDGLRYGVLLFGWGSCSGCDALQACRTIVEIEELRNELCESIKWFDSSAECLTYVETHDWEGDFSWHSEKMRKFLDKAKAILEFAKFLKEDV